MNYLVAINQFWQLRRSKRITNLQADLYFFLLQESNSRGWENPFQCSNGLVCSGIGITEKSLIDARNVLQQLGLIAFEKGVTKKKAPVYELIEYWNTVSNPVSIPVSNQGGNPVSNEGNIITKQKKIKQKQIDGADAPTPSKNSFKKFSEEDFKNEIRVANNDLKLPDKMLHQFFRYWSERSASGMMKFQMEKTWETIRRLETWRDNQSKFERNGSKTNWGSNPVVAGVSGPGRSIVRDQL